MTFSVLGTLFLLAIGIVIGFLLCAFLAVQKVRSGFDITLVNDEVQFKARQ